MADTFTGNGEGAVLFGGYGNDTFHMRDGDVAVGGVGADSYYVTTSLGGTISISMDYQDKLYINGICYDGIRFSGSYENTIQPDNSINTYQTVNAISSFKNTVEGRLVTTDKGVGHYPDIDKTKPFDLVSDDHPERSESFVWNNAGTGVLRLNDGGTVTKIVLTGLSDQNYPLDFQHMYGTNVDVPPYFNDNVSGAYAMIGSYDGYSPGLFDTVNMVQNAISQFDYIM